MNDQKVIKSDIRSISDVKKLVDTFYAKVQQDELLAPIFNERIADNWDVHLEKMYRFWQTILLEEHTYYGSPFAPHANMPIDQTHFNNWITLFTATLEELFEGEKVREALWRAKKMAQLFQYKIEYYKNNSSAKVP